MLIVINEVNLEILKDDCMTNLFLPPNLLNIKISW